jgi:peptidoglycan/xylan/chitin deacetylase (PgdA/CDA1 family)
MKTRGVITLVFDDGYQRVYDEVLPLLASYNVRAVFAIPLTVDQDMIAGEKIVSSKKWLTAAKKHHHEIAAHSITHTNLTTLSATELKKELTLPSQELKATTIVYPGGAHNDAVVTKAKEVYSAGRTVLHGLESLPPKDMMRLSTINFTKKNFSVVRANIRALQAWLQSKWLIETYHMVSDTMSPLSHSALLDDLDAHLDFITSLPIKVSTIQEVTKSL